MIDLSDLPNPQRRALELVKEVSAEKECRPYLVGGPVRDLLLGRQAIDIDLTLEEGSSTLARALAKRVEGRVRSFPQFLTYKVTAAELPEIDIATARKERYRKPGALPSVAAGRLKDDLLRRDFSINAIALDLVNGAMHDPAHGERDLASRVVRVLHEQSFADDQTRIFRAIRLAGRLGFAIEPQTAALMREAIAADALNTVSKERVWRELFLAMDEEDAPKILAALNDQGALTALFGPPRANVLPALEQLRAQIEADSSLDRYVLYTSAFIGPDTEPAQLEGSGFSQKRARNALHLAKDMPRLEQAIADAHSERQRFRLFRTVSPEMLSILAAKRPAAGKHVERFHEYENFKLALRGNDLEMPGGPHIAKALERTREAVFTGEIPPEQARTFAREMAIKYLRSDAPPGRGSEVGSKP